MATKLADEKGLRPATIAFAACCIWLTLGSRAAFPQTPQERAWGILQTGLNEHRTSKRAAAVRALGFLQGNPAAIEFAEKALGDNQAAVRAAAATSLGQLGERSSISQLKVALGDKDNRVYYAAADSLILLGDPAGYDAYYRQLTGERKSGEGIIPDKKKLITDPSALMLLGFGVGIGYAPLRHLWMDGVE